MVWTWVSEMGPEQVWAACSSLAFDYSVWEIWGALLHGGRLVVVPEQVTRSPRELQALLVDERVTVLSQTPSAVGMLSPEGLESVSALMVAAEPCPQEVVQRWAPGRVMINGYGPTETTVYATISAPLQAWVGCESRSVCRYRAPGCSCWTNGYAKSRQVWWGSCMWPGVASASVMCAGRG